MDRVAACSLTSDGQSLSLRALECHLLETSTFSSQRQLFRRGVNFFVTWNRQPYDPIWRRVPTTSGIKLEANNDKARPF